MATRIRVDFLAPDRRLDGIGFFANRRAARGFLEEMYAQLDDFCVSIGPLSEYARPQHTANGTRVVIRKVKVPKNNPVMSSPYSEADEFRKYHDGIVLVRHDCDPRLWFEARHFPAKGKPRTMIFGRLTDLRDSPRPALYPGRPVLAVTAGGADQANAATSEPILISVMRVSWIDPTNLKLLGFSFFETVGSAKDFIESFYDLFVNAGATPQLPLPPQARPIHGPDRSFIAEQVMVRTDGFVMKEMRAGFEAVFSRAPQVPLKDEGLRAIWDKTRLLPVLARIPVGYGAPAPKVERDDGDEAPRRTRRYRTRATGHTEPRP